MQLQKVMRDKWYKNMSSALTDLATNLSNKTKIKDALMHHE